MYVIKLEFSGQFVSKNTQISNFMKIRQLGADLFFGDTDRQTDRHHEANSRFSKFS